MRRLLLALLVGLRRGALALPSASSWAQIDTDLSAPNVVVSPRAAAAGLERPRLLVYLAGHLRTFLLIAPQMRALLDAIAGEGADVRFNDRYAVYMHTWDELEHSDAVWWRSDPAQPSGPQPRPNVSRALSDPSLNTLFANRRFVARVDPHPGSAAISSLYGTAHLNAHCEGGIKCIDHTAAQVHELRIVHALAARHLGGAARWQLAGARGRDGAGAGADAEAAAAAAWAALPVLKSRPDVLLADGWRAQEGLPRMHKAFTKAAAAAAKRLAGAAAREGPPGGGGGGGGEEEEAAEGEGGAPGARVLGHKGPWPGGWGDIAWAMPLGTFDKVLGKVGFGRLAPLLRDEAVGGFGGYRVLVAAKASRRYHAEQAWREILIKSGVSSFSSGWFAGLAKARLQTGPGGRLAIADWHRYRSDAWLGMRRWLDARGVPSEWAPIALAPPPD